MLRFEVDGANAAEKFLRDRGADDAAVRKVWLSIALHTTPGVPEFLDPEIALVTAGVETDVLGIGLDDLPDDVAMRSLLRIPDRISNAASCGPSPTATGTGPAAHSATSTPTCWHISTRRSSATTSSRSSSITAGLSRRSRRGRYREAMAEPTTARPGIDPTMQALLEAFPFKFTVRRRCRGGP